MVARRPTPGTAWLAVAARRLRAGLAAGALAATLGCGGSTQPVAEIVPPPVQPQPPPAPVPAPAPIVPAPVVPPPAPPPPPKPARPEDLAQWSPDDFRSAKQEGDFKLGDAVKKLGERENDEAAAQLLAELLVLEKPDAAGAAGAPAIGGLPPQPPRPLNLAVVQNIVDLLAANKSGLAADILRQLIAGTLETGLDQRSVALPVLKALATHPTQQHEDLLLAAAFTPEALVAPAGNAAGAPGSGTPTANPLATLPPDQLQQAAANEVRTFKSPEFRLKLAARLGQAGVPEMTRKLFEPSLVESRSENLPAQVRLFIDGRIGPQIKEQLERQFSAAAVATFDELLGVPANFQPTSGRGGFAGVPVPGPPGVPGAVADPDQPYLMARHLWQPELVAKVREKLLAASQRETKLADLMPLIVWAAALPLDDVRSALAEVNKKTWEEGPDAFRNGGMFGAQLRDPAFILIVKTTPRKEESAKKPDARRPGLPAPSAKPAPAGNKKVEAKDKAKHEWMDASEEFVRLLAQRFHAAALARPAPATAPAEEEEPGAALPPTSDERMAASGTGLLARLVRYRAANDPEEPADQPEDDSFGTAAAAAKKPPAAEDKTLPFRLHGGAKPVAEYHLNWPAEIETKLEGVPVSSLVVHYVRIEEKNRAAKLAALYQHQLKGSKNHLLDNGRWIDYLGEGITPDARRSVDVLITTKEAGPPSAPGAAAEKRPKSQTEDLVIEVLSIEAIHPRKAATASDERRERDTKPSQPATSE